MQSYKYSLKILQAFYHSGLDLIKELLKKEPFGLNPYIFATDIDQEAIEQARQAVYSFESLKDVKYGLLKEYFSKEDQFFTLKPDIKKMVNFSLYNMLDKKRYAPPESVYGNFDIVLCCNILIV